MLSGHRQTARQRQGRQVAGQLDAPVLDLPLRFRPGQPGALPPEIVCLLGCGREQRRGGFYSALAIPRARAGGQAGVQRRDLARKVAQIKPGDVALVIGSGTIGIVTAMAAMAGGCSKVIVADVVQEKLDLATSLGMIAVNATRDDLNEIVRRITEGWGADIVFEASGSEAALSKVFEPLCPGGRVVFIGMPAHPVPVDMVSAQVKEARIETIFRYAHAYPAAIRLTETGKVNLKPLVTDRYRFEDSIKAFEYAANPRPSSVKTVIEL